MKTSIGFASGARRVAAAAAAIAVLLAAAAAAGPRLILILDTGSMRPAVGHDMLLALDPVPYRDLRVGEVAVYRHDRTGLVVAHRIVGRQFGWYVMKGDANRSCDTGFMTASNYMGIVHLPPERRVAAVTSRRSDRLARR